MSQDKKSTVGGKMWVESIMSTEEWKERYKKYPATSTVSEPISFSESIYEGGKWRDGMGKGYSAEQIIKMNKETEKLFNYLKSKEDATI